MKRDHAFLGLLIAGDLLLVGLHLLHIYSRYFSDIGISSYMFSLTHDGGVGEIYQYLKMYWIVLLLVGVSVRSGKLAYLSWTFLFLFLLLDDSLQIHEQLGAIVSSRMGYTAALHLRAQDLGELTVVCLAGLFLGSLLSLTCWRGDPQFRRISRDLALLVGLVVLFVVGIDMLHGISDIDAVIAARALLEDGGEIVAMSFVCWYVYRVFLQGEGEDWLGQDHGPDPSGAS